jgi:hypothetical protein
MTFHCLISVTRPILRVSTALVTVEIRNTVHVHVRTSVLIERHGNVKGDQTFSCQKAPEWSVFATTFELRGDAFLTH